MEAEKIIILKQYFELTPSEKDQVSELVSNEAEFNDVKAFLLSTEAVFESQKITDTSELDNKVMAHLNAGAATSRTWYNSFLLFLFPRDRRVYQYPAFQIGLATVLVFGAFNLINFDSLSPDSMAYEEVSEVQNKVVHEEGQKEGVVAETIEKDVMSEMSTDGYSELSVGDEKTQDNVPSNVTVTNQSQYDYNYSVMEEVEEMDFEDAEILSDDVSEGSIELEEELNSDLKNNSDRDVINTADADMSSYKEEEKVSVNEVTATTAGSTTIAKTESRNDKGFKFDRNKDKVSKKNEMPASAADEYSNNSTIQVASEQPMLEEQSVERKASINITPELKVLFFEVK